MEADRYASHLGPLSPSGVKDRVIIRLGSDWKLAPEFAVGTLDAGLMLSPENRPVVAGDLASQQPFTAWMRRGLERTTFSSSPSSPYSMERHPSFASKAASVLVGRVVRSSAKVDFGSNRAHGFTISEHQPSTLGRSPHRERVYCGL
jgi:hypothetical protein